jgi:hypothetical protein
MSTTDTVTATIDGVRIHANVRRDPDGRIVSARCTSTGDPVPALVDPDADPIAAIRATLI